MSDACLVRQKLLEAIGTGEVIGIIYHGGSQPGRYREIVPLKIDDRIARARCRTSGAAKMFSLDKIALQQEPPKDGDATATWDVNVPVTVELASISEVEAAYRVTLEGIGWHVVCTADERGDRLCLHRWTKDRTRPIKNVAVSLRYSPMTYDFEVDDRGNYRPTTQRENSKPWSVGGGSGTAGGPWKFSGKAVEAFLREAAAL